jgi:hypothetical protein
MSGKLRLASVCLCGALCAAVTLIAAAGAPAATLGVKIRQIHPSTGVLGGEWVELQMYAPNQNGVAGKVIRTFYPDGSDNSMYVISAGDGSAPNGQSQRTILISNLFMPDGVAADFVAPVADLQMTGQDGAVCLTENNPPTYTPIDCVSYGNFTGSISSAGTPAVATPFESTLERRITANCPTLLEAADDTNDSSADFALSDTPPRNNGQAPTETACAAPKVRCGGLIATKVGTGKADTLIGTRRRDVIAGLGGNDTIRGLAGNDVLCGGKGRDRLFGGKGRDRLFGGPGPDLLRGGPAKDVLRGGPGRDRLVQ